MEERDWYILLSLYEQKSITKTAEALFISQSTLTIRLQHIEDRFGTQIVVRGKKGVTFTPAGKYLLECAKEMLHKMHVIEGTIRTIENEVAGSLNIGASNFFARYKLPELLRQFKERYPRVEFKVVTNLSGKIVDLIYNHDIDVGFIRGEYSWPDKKYLLFVENMYVVSKQEINIECLPEMPRIDYISNKTVQGSLNEWWKENFSQKPFIGMKVDRVDSCKEMVSKGLGYAFLPDGILDNTDKLFKIKMIDKDGKPVTRQTWLFYHEDNLKIELVKTFVEFVTQLDVYAL
jgi:DNA-binding transcriptional LysR family regulator